MDGSKGSTGFPDSSASKHVMKSNAGASVDTSQSVSGGASGKFVAASKQYLSTPDSADWYFNTGDFTIDFYVRFSSLPAKGTGYVFFSQYKDANNFNYFRLYNSGGKYQYSFASRYGGSTKVNIVVNSDRLSANTWYHVAVVRSGNSWYFFQNGVQQGKTQTSSGAVGDIAAELRIMGGDASQGAWLNGWCDQFRVSKGLARWTSNFTPPLLV
jgi:hypothetical protein